MVAGRGEEVARWASVCRGRPGSQTSGRRAVERGAGGEAQTTPLRRARCGEGPGGDKAERGVGGWPER